MLGEGLGDVDEPDSLAAMLLLTFATSPALACTQQACIRTVRD